MSEFQTRGLNLTLFKPSFAVTAGTPNTCVWTPEGTYLGSFAGEVSSYQHTINAVGGYEKASFTLTCNPLDLAWWLAQGLGLHVVTRNPGGVVVWEGYVNTLSVNIGTFQMAYGPLQEIGNQVTGVYSLLDTSTNPPTAGVRMRTGVGELLASQQVHGLWPQVVSLGSMPTVEANYVRDTWIAERAWPATTKVVSLGSGGGGALTLTFECQGYYTLLDYPYYQVATTGTINASAKVGAILAAAPNALFSTANADITMNTLQVVALEEADNGGWNIIKGIVTHGDASANRYVAGVWADRRFVYGVIPTAVEYHQRLSDPLAQVTNIVGVPVAPWDVLPGKWLMFPDFVPSWSPDTLLLQDPRVMFIESLSFTAPDTLSLQGGKVDRLTQRLSQLGLGGA